MGRPSTLTGTSCPLNSTCGGRPGEKIKSLTCLEVLSMAIRIASVIDAGCAAAGAAGAAAVGVGLAVVLTVFLPDPRQCEMAAGGWHAGRNKNLPFPARRLRCF